MSHKDALENNIRFAKNGYNTFYFPSCHICGEEVASLSFSVNLKYTCKECKRMQYFADRINKVKDNTETKELKFEKALKRIQNTPRYNAEKYKKAFQTVHDQLHTDGWFDSTEEIMAAIELLKSGFKVRHQVAFGRYRADFVLPQAKVVLEIDGTVFHNSKTREKEKVRDNLILLSLGPDWEVIRIKDVDLNQNISKLSKAIKEIIKERKRIRSKYDGQLPEWYSN